MIRIMFVCHGNICRSPMAELILGRLLQERNIEHLFTVSSSATSTEEIWNGIGNPIYPPARAELERHGFCNEALSKKRAVQLIRADYERYDLFVGMDERNMRGMHAIFGGDPDKKIHKLMKYAGSDADVCDPWYSDRFDLAYRDIEKGCIALLEHLQSRLQKQNKGEKI